MRRRISDHLRCPRCRLHDTLCLCALIPTLPVRTHVVLILHQLEVHKPTNTGRLAVQCLPNSRTVLRGTGGDGTVGWPEEAQPLLLFPHEHARPLTEWRDSSRPVALIVPDGTWSQAIKVQRRMKGLADLPAVALPPTLTSTYRLRHDERPGHVSTLEAIACALGILEGPTVEAELLAIQRIMVERTLWTNGRIATDAVAGGIPPGRHHNGRYGGPTRPEPASESEPNQS